MTAVESLKKGPSLWGKEESILVVQCSIEIKLTPTWKPSYTVLLPCNHTETTYCIMKKTISPTVSQNGGETVLSAGL